MMRRVVVKSIVMLIAMSSTVALLAPLACGKYGSPERVTQDRVVKLFCDELGYDYLGSPERVTQPRAPDPPEAGEAAVELDRDAEADRADRANDADDADHADEDRKR